MEQTAITIKTLRPYVGHGRATISESPVDETQRDSGLIVPLAFDGDDGLKRGIILHVAYDPAYPSPLDTIGGLTLDSGVAVFFRRGVNIAGTIVVELHDVIAYEADE